MGDTSRDDVELNDAVVVEREGPIGVVSINLPGQRNALNLEQRRRLTEAIRSCLDASDCRAVVLRGEGAVFCAGGDISSMSAGPQADERLRAAAALAETIVMTDKPVIAAVQGGAYGLGLALVAACDYVVAARDAHFIASFGRIGLGPDTAISWSLPRRIGYAHARRMLLWAERLPADEAHQLGLVDELVEPTEVRAVAVERAGRVGQLATGSLAAVKSLLRSGEMEEFRRIADEESVWQQRLFESADFAEGQRAFFERRPPVFGNGIA